MAHGIQAFDQAAAAVVAKLQGLLRRIDVTRQLAGGIDLVAVDATIGPFAFYQVAASVIAEMRMFPAGIDALTQAATEVVVVQRLRIATVAEAE
ncbi:hypothetical protein D3C76_818950 [compost metagenome]